MLIYTVNIYSVPLFHIPEYVICYFHDDSYFVSRLVAIGVASSEKGLDLATLIWPVK